VTTPRHTRQIMLREIGGAGQAKLRGASVVIIGAGGLGGPAALYLAAAGVGNITLIDPDLVDDSNLQRQIQFTEADLGQSKTQALSARMRHMDNTLAVSCFHQTLDADNAIDLLKDHTLILDGTDNFDTRFVVNAASRALGIPLISGAVAGWTGQLGVFNLTVDAPCYRCLVPEVPPDAMDCETVGIVGAVAGIVGSAMAMEAVKLMTGAGEPLSGRLWLYNGLSAQARTVTLPRDPGCPVCA